ncbi:YfcC family protein [Alkalihalobacillus sp. 1P02AB]|uniref:YfcC family protein n=1 Tax=Alkalihalobacillus sp. 1P02AB TaxID=3132260 RepID=UPI0039A62C0E
MNQNSLKKEVAHQQERLILKEPENKKPLKFPHIYVILFGIIAFMSLLSFFIPSGEYERTVGENGQTTIDAESFTFIENATIGIIDFISAIPTGFMAAAPVVFATFVLGGSFMVLQNIGLIQFGVDRLIRAFSKKRIVIIPVLITAFATLAAFVGTPELCLLYVPILIPLMIKLGYNKILATAIALVGPTAGFLSALTNPGTVGVSHEIAGLPMYSGAGYRFLVIISIVLVSSIFLMLYAKKLEKNPELVEEDRKEYEANKNQIEQTVTLTFREKVAGVTAILLFIGLVAGILTFRWSFIELAGYFLILGIIVGVIAGMSGEGISESFNKGFKQVMMGAMIIGIARGVVVIMEESLIIDTIIYALATVVSTLPSELSVIGMFFAQWVFNFFVPSGSGQAMITMPIMIPLSDILGITRQTATLAFQFGDGMSTLLFPTSGHIMAALAIAGVSWWKWIKFIFPLMLIWLVLGCTFLLIAHFIGWGPF